MLLTQLVIPIQTLIQFQVFIHVYIQAWHENEIVINIRVHQVWPFILCNFHARKNSWAFQAFK